jgi:hypothetical protein
MAIPFEFVIPGPPVSLQARRSERRDQWKQDVRSAAEKHWGGEPPFTGPVAVTITYFFGRVWFDVDNIPKPILDAMEGLVYANDRQIFDLLCRKRELDPNLRIRNASPMLSESLQAGGQFLHIIVANVVSHEVTF